MVQLYHENYSRIDIEHHYEKWTMLDQIYLFQGRVPFKKITAVAGFAAWMLEEADIRKIVLDDNDPKKLSLLLRKGVYPYSYFDSMERFSETQLPSKTAFYNDLTQEPISSEDYQHVQDIWETFNLQTLGDLCDLYCKSDVLLLSCIIDRYRDTCLSIYGLDPVHYYTAPGLTWDAGLKYTKVELQLLQDKDMYNLSRAMHQRGDLHSYSSVRSRK